MCRHSEAMGGRTLDCVGGTSSVGEESIQPQPRIKRSLSFSWFYCDAPESALSEVFVFDHTLSPVIERNFFGFSIMDRYLHIAFLHFQIVQK